MKIEFESPVTRWDKRVEAWYFATLPEEQAIREVQGIVLG